MPTIMNVVGARPQFIKAGPVSRALHHAGVEEILVHTGQHYDDLMSDAIMRDVGLRQPDYNLGVGSGSHGAQTAQMLAGIETLILDLRPDAVLTYGDTNSTIAAALAAAKLHVLTGHVEAGLRSFNREMPEELNRVATDHLSDILFAPTDLAMGHLAAEGLADRSVRVGDVMVDALTAIDLDRVEAPDWATGRYFAATIHRPSNTDVAERLQSVISAMGAIGDPVHLLAHPRLREYISKHSIHVPASVFVHDPLPYSTMLKVVTGSAGLITDSGGLQKEAFILGTPCATIRDETEWPETLEGGWNVLAGSDLHRLPSLVTRQPDGLRGDPFGNGLAADEIVRLLLERFQHG